MTAEERVTFPGRCPVAECAETIEWRGVRTEHGHGTTYRFITVCPRCTDTDTTEGATG